MRQYDRTRQSVGNRYVSTRKADEVSAALRSVLHGTTSRTVTPTPIIAVLEQTEEKSVSLPTPAVSSIAPEAAVRRKAASPAVVNALQSSAQEKDPVNKFAASTMAAVASPQISSLLSPLTL